jgi:hypothetical protein
MVTMAHAQSDPAPAAPFSTVPLQGFARIRATDTIHTAYQSGFGFLDIAGRSWVNKYFLAKEDSTYYVTLYSLLHSNYTANGNWIFAKGAKLNDELTIDGNGNDGSQSIRFKKSNGTYSSFYFNPLYNSVSWSGSQFRIDTNLFENGHSYLNYAQVSQPPIAPTDAVRLTDLSAYLAKGDSTGYSTLYSLQHGNWNVKGNWTFNGGLYTNGGINGAPEFYSNTQIAATILFTFDSQYANSNNYILSHNNEGGINGSPGFKIYTTLGHGIGVFGDTVKDSRGVKFLKTGDVPTFAHIDSLKDSTTIILPTIAALTAYNGAYKAAIVTDSLRGGIFIKTPGVITPDNGLTFHAAISGNYWKRQYDKSFGIDINWFGAVGDSITISTQAIKQAVISAHNAGVPIVNIGKGVFRVDSIINVPKNVTLHGQGIGLTKIYATGNYNRYYSGNNNIPDGVYSVIYMGAGSETYLNNLSTTVAKGQNYIILPSNPNLKEGDVIKLADTTSFSFSPFRNYYKSGQFASVKYNTTTDTVWLDQPLFDNYPTLTSAQVYKANLSNGAINNMTIAGLDTGYMITVFAQDVGRTAFENLQVLGGSRSAMEINYCFDVGFNKVINKKFPVYNNFGAATDYGLTICSSQNINVDACNMYGYQHALATGQENFGTQIPDRYINVTNSTFNSMKYNSLNMHGCSEFIKIIGNNLNMGMVAAGKAVEVASNNIYLNDNNIIDTVGHNAGIAWNEPANMDFNIHNNHFYIRADKAATTAILFTEGSLTTQTDTSGMFRFDQNDIKYVTSLTGSNTIFNITGAATSPFPAKIEMSGNTLETAATNRLMWTIKGTAADKLSSVDITNNPHLEKVKLNLQYITTTNIINNGFYNSSLSAFTASNVDNINVLNNTFNGFALNPTATSEKDAGAINTAVNIVSNGNTGSGAGASALVNMYYNGVTNLYEGAESFNNSLSNTYNSVTNHIAFKYHGINKGQTTLVAGTKTITIAGLTSSSAASIGLVSIGGTVSTTWQYKAVCTANTLTITAITNSGAANTSDTSTLSYIVIQ